LPLQFKDGQSWQSLGLDGTESYDIETGNLSPRTDITVKVTGSNGSTRQFAATVRIDTPVELDYYYNGGILPTVLRKLAQA
jgi:aconitate hydratase